MTDIIANASAAQAVFHRQIVADLRASIIANQRLLDGLRNTLLGQGHIVMSSHGLALHFDLERDTGPGADLNRLYLRNPRPVAVAQAPRFTAADAARIAAATHDGTGEPFHAVHVTTALHEAIERDKRLLAALGLPV